MEPAMVEFRDKHSSLFQKSFLTLFSSLAFLSSRLIFSILPSIMSDGATMSAPARAKFRAMAAILSRLGSFSISPVSGSMMPQWPSWL
jgi:hypothetical protein